MAVGGFCPRCGTPRVGAFRFCTKCQYDFDAPPEAQAEPLAMAPVPPPPAQATPAASFSEQYAGTPYGRPFDQTPSALAPVSSVSDAPKRRNWLILGVIGVIGVLVVAAAIGVVIAAGSPSSGTVQPGNQPPAGTIWFGSSFDPTTFAISGRTSSISVGSPISGVAHLTRSMAGSELSIRVELNGAVIATVKTGWSGSGDIWGFTPVAPTIAGTWTYQLVDVGGNVLASGALTVQ
jgi:hypothetical protein